MDPKIDKETEVRLASGDVGGIPLQVEGQSEDGVTAILRNGDRVFLPKRFVDLIRYRNRGKD